MKVKSESEVAQSCPTLRNPMDCSLPGSSVRGIFQARVLEWGAIIFSASSNTWQESPSRLVSQNIDTFEEYWSGINILWNVLPLSLPDVFSWLDYKIVAFCHLLHEAWGCWWWWFSHSVFDPMDCSPPGSSVHGISQARNTAMGCYFLLQRIFLTQGSNPCLLHCRHTLYHWATGEEHLRILC